METKNYWTLASQAQKEFQKIGIFVNVNQVKVMFICGQLYFFTCDHEGLNAHYVARVEALKTNATRAEVCAVGEYFLVDASHHAHFSRTEWRYDPVENEDDFELITQDFYTERNRQKKLQAQAEKL